MATYTPLLEYPRDNQTSLSDKELASFNINDKGQVANFVEEAIDKIILKENSQPNQNDINTMGLIIEGMLSDELGDNDDALPYRKFVMNYVIGEFPKAKSKHEDMVKALIKAGYLERIIPNTSGG